MKLKLVYNQDDLGQAWSNEFSGCDDVEIIGEDITTVPCDAIVSPANSFGFMDGGLDLTLTEKFGDFLQKELQKQIRELPERELLVGRALVLETHDRSQPYLIAAPTMRVPMSFGIATSVNAYLAMKAILIAVRECSHISVVAIPGLCTGVGRMPAAISARQMRFAYDEVIRNVLPDVTGFNEVQNFQLDLNPESMIWSH